MCSPSQPWAAIFSHTGGSSVETGTTEGEGTASASARGSVGGQCVSSQRCAVRRSDSCSSVTAMGIRRRPRARAWCRCATARSRRPGSPVPAMRIFSSGDAVGSVTTACPSSLRSNVSGAQNMQLPDPMHRSQSIWMSIGSPSLISAMRSKLASGLAPMVPAADTDAGRSAAPPRKSGVVSGRRRPPGATAATGRPGPRCAEAPPRGRG